MALQSSGTIKMSEINTELGRSSNSEISLDSAENGSYATINTASASYPSSSNPANMSEWYSYDHSASSAHSISQSIVFDGTNDGARFLDTGATAPISQIFNSDNGGGTVAMAFRVNGTTSYTNSYILQAGWGGGWNWLFWLYPWDDVEFNLRFRQHRTSNNFGGWSVSSSSGDTNFEKDVWYFIAIVYDNSSTSNTPNFHYGAYTSSSLTDITSPYEEKEPQGSARVNTAHYAGVGVAKNGNVPRPWKANVSLLGMWDKALTEAECDTLFNGGEPYDFSSVQSSNLLFFHDMQSISSSVVSPHTGGSTYDLTLVNGATTSSDVPS